MASIALPFMYHHLSSLRRRYLHLLLLYPAARESRDAVTHLWMQTSYANPVEGRKMLQRFRQFLADEERFWRALVLRVQSAYGYALTDADDAAAGIAGLLGTEETLAPDDRTNQFGFPAEASTMTVDGEPADEAFAAFGRVEEAHAKSVLSKALVCLGDIARYREQYKGSKVHEAKKKLYEPRANYARPRALYMAAHALAPHEGNAAHQLAILAGYETDTLASVAWYLRALCVRAGFETAGENLAGVLSRVRAAHAQGKSDKWSQDAAEDSAEPPRVRVERFKRDLVLLHALWRAPATTTQTLALASHTARAFARLVAERALPEEMIVRVGVMAQGAVWVGRMVLPAAGPGTSSGDNTDFGAEKEKDKTDKDRSRRRRHASAPAPVSAQPLATSTPPEVQAAQLAHLLALQTALLDVGVRELEDAGAYTTLGTTGGHGHGGGARGRRGRGGMNGVNGGAAAPAATGQELAERISAVFRRTLPALRVGSKWMLGNWVWVRQAVAEANSGEDETGDGEKERRELSVQAVRFWTTYAEFLRMLGRAFPVASLPALREGEEGDVELELEEDVDMRGWLPLHGLMGGPLPPDPEDKNNLQMPTGEGTATRRPVGPREEVHPNVEQLMRIADLLRDARRIVELEGSPLALYGGQFVAKGVEAAKPVVPDPLSTIRDVRFALQTAEVDEDAMTEKTSRTDDDILHDAFSFLNNAPTEEDEASDDEIVWDLRDAPVSPVVPTARTSPKTPVRPAPIAPPSRAGANSTVQLSPFRAPQPMASSITPGTQIPATTALDLLNNFSVPVAASKPLASPNGPGESLLFGTRFMFAGGHHHQQQQQQQLAPQYQGHGMAQHQRFASQDLSGQSTIWASSYPGSQHAGFPQQQSRQLPTHQRVVSNSMAAAQLFPSGGGDPFGYGPAPTHYGGGGDMRAGAAGFGSDQLGVFYSSSPSQTTFGGPHARHASGGGSAFGPGGQVAVPPVPIPPLVSQLWSNVG
ncbi:hypothetical protein FB45DRAFT_921994 [Roridomyces roridus]|uniref:DNA/RNA-binding domain-containing protein n=1 Tax=Roridomyces roridus TaxID=1738132 RepID=A0AAD7BN13_9AGAR|nr:hypothetical protein FB45DRAFT_921994 [Roridomyces roridus]